MYTGNDLRIAGLCCSKCYIYVLGKENPEYVRVLDHSFYYKGNIASNIEDSQLNNLDMALIPGANQSQQQHDHSNHMK